MTQQSLTNFQQIIRTIGPGFLFAGAAIGGSHLIQSTRAGASFGFELIPIVILINLFKYPFFQFGQRYFAAKKENILYGYEKTGRWAIILFWLMSLVVSFTSTAGVLIITSGLIEYFLLQNFAIALESIYITAGFTFLCMVLLYVGKYSFLDRLMKILITLLSVITVFTFFVAASKGMQAPPDYVPPSVFAEASILFIIALMGWMPAPIEASAWLSIWQEEKIKTTKYTPNMKQIMLDFNLGYISTSVLALFFLGIGAYVMYGTGQEFAVSGVAFSGQLISLYTQTLGTWLLPIISTVAFITMFSTTLTVFDAYPRVLAISTEIIFKRKIKSEKHYWLWMAYVLLGTFSLIMLFSGQMRYLVDFVTTVSFISSAVFAVINFKAVNNKDFPDGAKPKNWLLWLSYAGIIFLWGFSFLYIVTLLY